MSVPVGDIQRLLRSPEVRGINFSYNGVTVDGRSFAELTNHFSNVTIPHRIRVTTNPAIVGSSRSSTFAAYEPNDNKINVRSDNILDNVLGRAQFVHECVHAVQDERRVDMRIIIAEGMAYIAQTWYLLNSGVSSNILEDSSTPELIAVTLELRATYGAQFWPDAPQNVTLAIMSRAQYSRVRQTVRDNYGYRTGWYDNNGI